ncbi:MAG: rhomboid family intramembrane serine protease [Planctomycetes bacterium]|nr:rhomboid family intramembrane serine protease [Planctomycetota bacterium]
MFPIRDALPTRNLPLVVKALVAVNVVVFLLTWEDLDRAARAYGAVAWHYTGQAAHGLRLPDGTYLAPVADDGRTILRTLAHMFVHGSLMHILGNMWFLWVFGDNVEDRLGRVRFVVFYVLCGLAALAAQVISDPASGLPMVGASGAIGGVMGAYLRLHPGTPILTFVPLGFYPLFFTLPAAAFLLYWLVIQALMGVTGLLGPSAGGGVAFWAHVGGFVAGFLLVGPMAPRPRTRARIEVKWD